MKNPPDFKKESVKDTVEIRDEHGTAQDQTKVVPWSCTCACMILPKIDICVPLCKTSTSFGYFFKKRWGFCPEIIEKVSEI